ncbi:hypothetical protein [Novosphingobium mathurense]|uniref:Uncharacterized protein n=1 Tax=Novosphingobium mathurense TaxID=428990 RepID=A0A1U6I7S1_9SPHN|nr:hypothetical protein [Novosphingobium mathurense]SLK04029.1 hypothetical protein SAMN06295987_104326 [Novosphingobium mathurense]
MSKQLIAETQREVSEWPDATMTQEQGGKHPRIVLHYKGESRMVVVANTPSDVRALKNHIATVRRELRGMGATKHKPVASNMNRERNYPQRIDMPSEPAPVRQNPFENLGKSTMSNQSTIDAIFSNIERLRYSEMLEFAAILSNAACQEKMRRSNVNEWARTLHTACVHRERYGAAE